MPQFQGSGFTLTLPSGCHDASAYTFVLPADGGFAANLIIRFEDVAADLDLAQYADKALSSLSGQFQGFKLVNKVAGKRGDADGLLATVEWGEGPARMTQKHVYLLTPGKKARLYILTTTDLAANAAKSNPVFDQILRSFAPNEAQRF